METGLRLCPKIGFHRPISLLPGPELPQKHSPSTPGRRESISLLRHSMPSKWIPLSSLGTFWRYGTDVVGWVKVSSPRRPHREGTESLYCGVLGTQILGQQENSTQYPVIFTFKRTPSLSMPHVWAAQKFCLLPIPLLHVLHTGKWSVGFKTLW